MTAGQQSAAKLARYRSLAQFYLADSRRIDSRERDFGLWWRDGEDGPLHRAAWVRDTGELYLVRLGPQQQGGGAVEILGVFEEQECLEAVLGGWREAVVAPDSLRWLRERLTGVRRRVRSAREAVGAATAGAALGTARSSIA